MAGYGGIARGASLAPAPPQTCLVLPGDCISARDVGTWWYGIRWAAGALWSPPTHTFDLLTG